MATRRREVSRMRVSGEVTNTYSLVGQGRLDGMTEMREQ